MTTIIILPDEEDDFRQVVFLFLRRTNNKIQEIIMKTYSGDTKGKKRQVPNITQLQYESDGWKRLLSFILSENVYLKNRIAEILRNHFDLLLLEEVEAFQSNFIKMDEMIRILRNEIAEFDKLLIREVFEDGAIINKLTKKMKSIRNNIGDIEALYSKLKSAFNSYLSENIET